MTRAAIYWTMRFPSRFLLPALLALLLMPPPALAAPSADACKDDAPVDLFLSGGNALTTGTPAEGSAPFPAQAKFSVALVWLVGTWNSPPVAAPLKFSGNVNFSVWAQSSGALQLSTRFQVFFGVNDVRGATAYTTDTQRLGSTPKELKGTAAGVSLTLNPGDTIGMWIYVAERGSGGSVVFGGATPSRMTLALSPLNLSLQVSGRPGELRISGAFRTSGEGRTYRGSPLESWARSRRPMRPPAAGTCWPIKRSWSRPPRWTSSPPRRRTRR